MHTKTRMLTQTRSFDQDHLMIYLQLSFKTSVRSGFWVLKPYFPTIKPNLWSRCMHTILYPKNLTVTKLTYLVIKAFTGTPSRWRCQLTSNILNFLSPIHVVDLMSKWINDVISGKRTSLFHNFFLLRSYG